MSNQPNALDHMTTNEKRNEAIAETLDLIAGCEYNRFHCNLTGRPIGTMESELIEETLHALTKSLDGRITVDSLFAAWEENFYLYSFRPHYVSLAARAVKARQQYMVDKIDSETGRRELFCYFLGRMYRPENAGVKEICDHHSFLRDIWRLSAEFATTESSLLTYLQGLAVLDSVYGLPSFKRVMCESKRLKLALVELHVAILDESASLARTILDEIFTIVHGVAEANRGLPESDAVIRKNVYVAHVAPRVLMERTEDERQEFLWTLQLQGIAKREAAEAQKKKPLGTRTKVKHALANSFAANIAKLMRDNKGFTK